MNIAVVIMMMAVCLLCLWSLGRTQRRLADVVEEIDTLRARQAELIQMADFDDLTCAYSRRYMRELFGRERQLGNNALVFIDLDNFKSVNDGFGHKSGDALLRSIAERLVEIARPNEVVFRIGGDEFGVYMRDISLEDATARAAVLCIAVSDVTIYVDGVKVRRTGSVGVARIEKDQDLVGALYYADEAQYAVKRDGGNAVRANTGATLRSMIQRRTGPRAEDLAAAIERDEVTYYVQPIFDTRFNRAIGVEALIRWQKADGRVILPDQFIEVMNGKYNARIPPPVNHANRIADAFTRGPNAVFCAFNVTSDVLDEHKLDDDGWVEQLLRGLNPERTVFEIVERAVIRDTGKTVHLLEQLRARGVRVALDDFGTGFSNLERLQELSVDIVKIDRRFVRNIDGAERDLGILRALLDMSRTMGFDIIAEGVETQAELDTLTDLGIYNVQGYLLGKPAKADYWISKLGLDEAKPKLLSADG